MFNCIHELSFCIKIDVYFFLAEQMHAINFIDYYCKTYFSFRSFHTASRAKLSMLNTMSKIRGQVKSPGYPQAEGLLGECMAKYGRELGEDTNFGGFMQLLKPQRCCSQFSF